MKKCSTCGLAVFLMALISSASAQDLKLQKTTHLPQYPSSSALQYYDGRLFVIGDDARNVLILDSLHGVIDSIPLYGGKNKRVPKNKKADLESSILLREKDKTYIVAFSSLSTRKRNHYVLIDADRHQKIRTSTFSMKHPSVREWNLEGAAWVNGQLLFGNRANASNPVNQLVLTSFDPSKGIESKPSKVVDLLLPTKELAGISGFSYLPESDLLLFAASTEQTSSAYEDGAIGESYIGYIRNFSKRLNEPQLKPDGLQSLKKSIGKKTPQKIESLAVEGGTRDGLVVHLVSDNDNGESTLFKILWDLDR